MKTVGVWKGTVSMTAPGSCTIYRLHNNQSGEIQTTLWHESLDSLKDLRYLIERSIGQLEKGI